MLRIKRRSQSVLVGIILGLFVVGAVLAVLTRSPSDQTGSLKRYVNRPAGIELSYPSDWRLEIDTQQFEQGDLVSLTKLNQSPVARTELYDGARFSVGIPIEVAASADSWARSYYAAQSVDDSTNEYGQQIIAGLSFTTVKTCSILGCSNYYHTKKGDKLFSFLLIAEGKSSAEHFAQMEAMLSSLKLK